MRRALLLLLFLCFARSPELIAAPRFDALFTTRVEYYDDEEYFGGRYAPLYQSVQFSLDHLYKDKVGFNSYLFTAKNLASGDDFDSKVYSMFLEVRDVSRLSSGRFGRFVLTSGVGIQTLTGADVTLSPGKDLNLELYLGRNKVFYDTRFQEPLLFRAPFTDTGLVYGGNLGVNKFRSAKLQVGWQTFDSETEAEPQNYMTYQFSGQFPRKLLFELRGYQNVSSDAGSEFHARITGPLGGGGAKVHLYADRLEPNRVNPEIITSVFVADTVSILGSGASVSITDRVSLFGDYEHYWFDTPGGADPSRQSHVLKAGLEGNYWTAAGLLWSGYYRYLSGDAGNLHQISFSGEKKLTGFLSGGWRLDSVFYTREGEERHNAYIIAALVKLYLRRDLWVLWELEDYHDIDFDYNFRTRFSLNFRVSENEKK